MNAIQSLSSKSLLDSTRALVAEERRITLLLLEHLREVERRMLHAELGCTSLYEFCVRHLGLSEGSAHRRISAMRLMRELPEARKAVEMGRTNLSNLTTLRGFFQQEKKLGKARSVSEKQELLKQMEGLSKRECERKLQEISPEAIPKERERVLPGQKTELRLVLDQATMEKFEHLKGLLAHPLPQATYSELIKHLLTQELARLTKKKMGTRPHAQTQAEAESSAPSQAQPHEDQRPLTSPARSNETEKSETPRTEPTPRARPRREHIPRQTRRAVWQRAHGQCEFQGEAGRCTSRYQLEIDHVRPVALQGSNDRGNLRLLCRVHNLQQASTELGTQKMEAYLPGLRL